MGHVRDLPKKQARRRHRERLRGRPTVADHAARRGARRAQGGAPRTRTRSTSPPTPTARARRSPGTSREALGVRSKKNVRRVIFNEITKKAVQRGLRNPGEARHGPGRRAAGAPHPRPDRRLQAQPPPLEEGRAAASPPAACSRSPCADRRARARDPRLRARGVLDGRPRELEGGEPPPFTRQPPRGRGAARTSTIGNADAGGQPVAPRAGRRGLRRGRGREEGAPPPSRRRRSSPRSCSRRRREARASPSKKTMRIAQRLYEGIELGGDGSRRPHHVHAHRLHARLRRRARRGARAHRADATATTTCRRSRTSTRSKKDAQDAHEAIRPTDVERDPERVKRFLSKDEYALYTLIWNRFVACQMGPRVYDETAVDIEAASLPAPRQGRRCSSTGSSPCTRGPDEKRETRPKEEPVPGADDAAPETRRASCRP